MSNNSSEEAPLMGRSTRQSTRKNKNNNKNLCYDCILFIMGQCLAIALQVLEAQQEEQPNQQSDQSHQQTFAPHTDGKLSPVHQSLPPGAEQYNVRNVYDGDTLTLVDERRVRFLGVDTPEIKSKQSFSQEAKAYTIEKCSDTIWISFEKEREDHYGRLLCFVWTATDDGRYLCVNEGLIHAGLASAYIPNQQSKLSNWDKLVKLQSEARRHNRGMWSTFVDDTVYKTANGSAFHKKDCKHLARSKHLNELKRSEAMEQGLHGCRTCMG